MKMIINYNITDFNQIEWNGLPFGSESNRNIEKEIAIIKFDNGYAATIRKAHSLEHLNAGLYDLYMSTSNLNEVAFDGISESEITTKLLEIQNL